MSQPSSLPYPTTQVRYCCCDTCLTGHDSGKRFCQQYFASSIFFGNVPPSNAAQNKESAINIAWKGLLFGFNPGPRVQSPGSDPTCVFHVWVHCRLKCVLKVQMGIWPVFLRDLKVANSSYVKAQSLGVQFHNHTVGALIRELQMKMVLWSGLIVLLSLTDGDEETKALGHHYRRTTRFILLGKNQLPVFEIPGLLSGKI